MLAVYNNQCKTVNEARCGTVVERYIGIDAVPLIEVVFGSNKYLGVCTPLCSYFFPTKCFISISIPLHISILS
jgi:hypothetical protein